MPGIVGQEKIKRYMIQQCIPENYGPKPLKYQKNIWDCEDYSFLAAADVRRHSFRNCQPIGIALGRILEDGKWQWHAVNILWYQDANLNWNYWIYDATFQRDVVIQNFDIHAIIPLPVFSSQDRNAYDNISPKKDFLKTAGYILDEKESYQFNLVDAAKEKLKNWGEGIYPPPGSEINEDLYIVSDEVFYWFAHIRKEFPGAPIGVAFGESKDYGKDFGALIIWKNDEEYTYWNIFEGGEYNEKNFIPRVVIA